jgi:serine/threonine-protein kinase
MTTRSAQREPLFKPKARFHLFIIERLLGTGGVAEVYEALYKGQRCAVKILQRRFHLDPTQMARANQEATVLSRIRHLNVIDVHEAGIHEGIFWMRMEFVEGIDLRTAIHRLSPMSVGLAGAWLVQAAYGAHQCHAFGVIHRDIKPENLFITRLNVVKLIDLGIAKMYGDLTTMQANGDAPAPVGTAPYMSPEQARGEAVTPASDVYALAMTFWEAVVGEHPFLGAGVVYEYWTMVHKQVSQEVPPLSDYGFPEDLSDVVARGLSKRWQDRPSSALAFARELIDACNRYVAKHPEESHPGEPAVIAMLDELRQPPSFGTGPMAARKSTAPRPRKPRTANGLGSAPVVHTILRAQTPEGRAAPAIAPAPVAIEPAQDALELDASERVTEPMRPPADRVVPGFQTAPMPPQPRGGPGKRSPATFAAQLPEDEPPTDAGASATERVGVTPTTTTLPVAVAVRNAEGPETARPAAAGRGARLRAAARRLGLPAVGFAALGVFLALAASAIHPGAPRDVQRPASPGGVAIPVGVPTAATQAPAVTEATAAPSATAEGTAAPALPAASPSVPASTSPPALAASALPPPALPAPAASHERRTVPPRGGTADHPAGRAPAPPPIAPVAAPAPTPAPTAAPHRLFGTDN